MVNRGEHHQRRLERASTDRAQLRAACAWLAAEAVHAGLIAQATRAVLDLVRAVRDTHPTTVRDRPARTGVPSPTPTRQAMGRAQRARVTRARGRAPARG